MINKNSLHDAACVLSVMVCSLRPWQITVENTQSNTEIGNHGEDGDKKLSGAVRH